MPPRLQPILVLLISATSLTFCTGATRPVQVGRAAHVVTNASPAETEAVLAAVHDQLLEELTARRGGLRRAVLQSVRVEEHLALVAGCGTFYDFGIPESWAITLVAFRNARGWDLHSWQVDTDGLHGPRQPCR